MHQPAKVTWMRHLRKLVLRSKLNEVCSPSGATPLGLQIVKQTVCCCEESIIAIAPGIVVPSTQWTVQRELVNPRYRLLLPLS